LLLFAQVLRYIQSRPAGSGDAVSLDAFPTVLDLVRNPFVLRLFVEALPGLTMDDQRHLTRYTIYNVFVTQWFTREIARLSPGDKQALGLVEGWTFRQFRAALDRSEHLQHLTRGQTDEAIMAHLGRSGQAAEGRFFPDTYTHGKGDTDLRIMRRAMKAMDRQLASAWQARAQRIELTDPEQALILASIVEKETGMNWKEWTGSRVMRGGGVDSGAEFCTVSYRNDSQLNYDYPNNNGYNGFQVGFRVALSLVP
jgi:hypothetical protein